MATAQDLKAARERLGESQTEFAKRFGVNQSTIHRWETDGISERSFTARFVTSVLDEIENSAADMEAAE